MSIYGVKVQPITRRQILDSSKLKDFVDDNFKFDKNGRKLSKLVKKHCGKRRNCSLRAISPFPTVFSKGLFQGGVKRCHCVGIGKYLVESKVLLFKKLVRASPSAFDLDKSKILSHGTGLTHYHTLPHFGAPKVHSCGKHCEKRRNCL